MIIYQIKDNNDNVLYVGETKRNAKDRFKEHLRQLKTGWHDNILLQMEYDRCGGKVKFEVVEKVKTIQEKEREYIKKLVPFCNLA